jgi:hypothetical protein
MINSCSDPPRSSPVGVSSRWQVAGVRLSGDLLGNHSGYTTRCDLLSCRAIRSLPRIIHARTHANFWTGWLHGRDAVASAPLRTQNRPDRFARGILNLRHCSWNVISSSWLRAQRSEHGAEGGAVGLGSGLADNKKRPRQLAILLTSGCAPGTRYATTPDGETAPTLVPISERTTSWPSLLGLPSGLGNIVSRYRVDQALSRSAGLTLPLPSATRGVE